MLQFIAEWARQLYADTGINLVFLYQDYERARFLTGFKNTCILASLCIVFSVVIGIVGAWAQGSKIRVVRAIMYGYIQVFRNTPPLVQLLFFYFALGKALERLGLMPTYDAGGWQAPYIDNFGWAVISLSMVAGSFNVEIFRAGIEAVSTTTGEAAESLGYTRLSAYVHIVLPLAFRICLPALNNNLVNLVRLRHRRARDALHRQPDVVRQRQRAGNDGGAVRRLYRPDRRPGVVDTPLGAADADTGVLTWHFKAFPARPWRPTSRFSPARRGACCRAASAWTIPAG